MRELPTLTDEQLICLRSAVRIAAFQALVALGPSTAQQIADTIGAKPRALYYHLDLLVKSGLAKIVETRPGATKPLAIYDAARQGYYVDVAAQNPIQRRHIVDNAASILRLAHREHARIIHRGVTAAELEVLTLVRGTYRLRHKDACELRDKLMELSEIARSRQCAEGELVSLTALLIPIGAAERGNARGPRDVPDQGKRPPKT